MRPAGEPDCTGAPVEPWGVRGLTWFVRTTTAVVLLVSLAVLSGYALHQPILTMLHPGLQAMSVVTATGVALSASALGAESFGHRPLARGLSALVLLIAAAILMSHAAAGADVVSGPLAERLFGTDAGLAGRTSGATAAGLLLLAVSGLLGGRPERGARRCLRGLGRPSSAALALIGYGHGVRDLYAFSPFNTRMAPERSTRPSASPASSSCEPWTSRRACSFSETMDPMAKTGHA